MLKINYLNFFNVGISIVSVFTLIDIVNTGKDISNYYLLVPLVVIGVYSIYKYQKITNYPQPKSNIYIYILALTLAGITSLRPIVEFNSNSILVKVSLVIVIVWGLTLLFNFIFKCIIKIHFKLQKYFVNENSSVSFWNASLPILIGWLIYFLIFFPGNMVGDGNYQLLQWYSLVPMTNHHPFLSTLFEAGLFSLGRDLGGDNVGLLVFSSVQMIICGVIYSYSIYLISRLGVPKKISIIFSIFVGVMPYWALLSDTLHKDGMFIAVFALYMSELIYITYQVLSRNNDKLTIHFILFTISNLLVSFWRNDGIFLVIIPLISLIFIQKFKYWVKFLIVLVTVGTVYITFNKVLLPSIGVKPTERQESLSLPLQQTARYMVSYPDEVTKYEKKIINQTFNNAESIPKLYDPVLSDPVKNQLKSDVNLRDYFKIWAQMGLKHPLNYMYTTFIGTDKYYNPWYETESFVYYGRIYDLFKPDFIKPSHVNPARVTETTMNVLHEVVSFPLINMLINTALLIWISIILGTYLYLKFGFSYVIPFIPIIVNLLVCIASPVNGLNRYSGGIIIPVYLLMVYFISITKFKNVNR